MLQMHTHIWKKASSEWIYKTWFDDRFCIEMIGAVTIAAAAAVVVGISFAVVIVFFIGKCINLIIELYPIKFRPIAQFIPLSETAGAKNQRSRWWHKYCAIFWFCSFCFRSMMNTFTLNSHTYYQLCVLLFGDFSLSLEKYHHSTFVFFLFAISACHQNVCL